MDVWSSPALVLGDIAGMERMEITEEIVNENETIVYSSEARWDGRWACAWCDRVRPHLHRFKSSVLSTEMAKMPVEKPPYPGCHKCGVDWKRGAAPDTRWMLTHEPWCDALPNPYGLTRIIEVELRTADEITGANSAGSMIRS
jgi:hypothetical protein